MADMIGQSIGNYRIISLLGTGSRAKVYLGEHIYLKSLVAVKVLHSQQQVEASRTMFLRESQVTARLLHPNIVRTLDFGFQDDFLFIVMEYAPNGALSKRHPPGAIVPLEIVISYVNQVASALQYIHNEHIIHGNVKPSNMLVGRNNQILLGIIDIFRSVNAEETFAKSTSSYVAPEQIRGKLVPASDQYALAAVVYEWLAGKPLFEGSPMEVISQHIFASPSPLRNRIPLIPPTVEQVLMKALAKDPKERFPSVQLFAQALTEGTFPTQNILPTPFPYGSSPNNVSSHQTPVSATPSPLQSGSSPTYANSPYTPYPQMSQPQSEVAPPSPPTARRFRSISWRGILVGLIGLITIAVVEVIANGGVAQLFRSPILFVGLVGLITIAVVGVIATARFK